MIFWEQLSVFFFFNSMKSTIENAVWRKSANHKRSLETTGDETFWNHILNKMQAFEKGLQMINILDWWKKGQKKDNFFKVTEFPEVLFSVHQLLTTHQGILF